MSEQIINFFIENWIYIALLIVVPILFKTWLNFIIKNRAQLIKRAKEETRNNSMLKDDIEAYIMQPEESIKALNIKRGILEKEKPNGYQSQIESIDQQIKWLQQAQKIPAIARKPMAHAGNMLMKKAEKWIDGM